MWALVDVSWGIGRVEGIRDAREPRRPNSFEDGKLEVVPTRSSRWDWMLKVKDVVMFVLCTLSEYCLP